VREQKGIEGGCCTDCLVMSFCHCCGLAQAANEVGALDMAQDMSRE